MVKLLYFLILSFICWFSFRWIWKQVLVSANVSRKEYSDYLLSSKSTGRVGQKWLKKQSANPSKTSMLIAFYNVGTALVVLCLYCGIVGLFTTFFDTVIKYMAIVIPLIAVLVATFGFFYKGDKEEEIQTHETNPFRDKKGLRRTFILVTLNFFLTFCALAGMYFFLLK